MNILIINYEFPPLGGGGGIFTRDLALELAKNHNVDVLTSHFRGLKKTESIGGVTVYRVPVLNRRSLYASSALSLLSFPVSGTLGGIHLMRKKKYDIINTQFAVPTGPAGVVLSRLFGVPNILTVQGSDIYNPVRKSSPHRYAILRWAVRTVLRNVTKVVASSTDMKYRTEHFYAPEKDITIIPLGLTEPDFSPVNRETLSMHNDRFYAISTGRMAKIKGYDFLIKATALLKEKGLDIELILVGDGQERAGLEKLSIELGVSDRVKFTGWLSGEKKFRHLSAADLYVLSSIYEAFGLVIPEAMFCGLPVIATNKGGQPDIVKDSRNGILVRPADAEALADSIETLVKDTDRRRTIGAYNREYAKRYSISAIAERYLELFHEVLDGF